MKIFVLLYRFSRTVEAPTVPDGGHQFPHSLRRQGCPAMKREKHDVKKPKKRKQDVIYIDAKNISIDCIELRLLRFTEKNVPPFVGLSFCKLTRTRRMISYWFPFVSHVCLMIIFSTPSFSQMWDTADVLCSENFRRSSKFVCATKVSAFIVVAPKVNHKDCNRFQKSEMFRGLNPHIGTPPTT